MSRTLARAATGAATSPTEDSYANADGDANDIHSQLANIPGADGIASANLILLGLSKPYKCPKPGCMKSYKQANGLKYHMTHGYVSRFCDYMVYLMSLLQLMLFHTASGVGICSGPFGEGS